MRLSQHFELSEFLRSSTALELGIVLRPQPWHVRNLSSLCVAVLEPLRAALGGEPITVTSGWRNEELNAAVGGVATSAHLTGCGADITARNYAARQVAAALVSTQLPFDQVILYPGQHVHVAIAPPRRDVRHHVNGSYPTGLG